MRIRVTREGPNLEPARIERPPTIAAIRVAFQMRGTTAVLVDGRDAKDLFEVVKQVRDLGFVNGVDVEP